MMSDRCRSGFGIFGGGGFVCVPACFIYLLFWCLVGWLGFFAYFAGGARWPQTVWSKLSLNLQQPS